MRKTLTFFSKRMRASGRTGSVSGPIIRIATASVALGIVVMLIAASTGIGLQEAIRTKISDVSGHVLITAYADTDGYTTPPFRIEDAFDTKTPPLPTYVESIGKFASMAGILKSRKEFEGVSFKGLDEDYPVQSYERFLVNGKLPSLVDTSNEIMVSEVLAKRLQIQLGDKVAMYFNPDGSEKPRIRTFILAGTFETGMEFIDESMVIGSLHPLRAINNWDDGEIGGIEIRLKSTAYLNQAVNHFHTETSYAVKAESMERKYPQIFQWIGLFDMNILVVLIIMILIAGINMITALLILMVERTPMIGTLKALGGSQNFIRQLFLWQGMRLMGKGLLYGNLIGLGFCLIQDQFGLIGLDPTTYYVDQVPISFPWMWIFGINLGTALTTLIMLWLPSGYVSRIQPVKAIRFE